MHSFGFMNLLLMDHSYNDDDTSKAAPPPAAAPEPAAPLAESVEPAGDDYNYNATTQAAGADYGEDSHMNGGEEYEDDDDDVDFNLGNSASHAPDTPSYNHSASASAPSRGPNAKEDG